MSKLQPQILYKTDPPPPPSHPEQVPELNAAHTPFADIAYLDLLTQSIVQIASGQETQARDDWFSFQLDLKDVEGYPYQPVPLL
eukprot:5710500-Amphidinium_carterae.1